VPVSVSVSFVPSKSAGVNPLTAAPALGGFVDSLALFEDENPPALAVPFHGEAENEPRSRRFIGRLVGVKTFSSSCHLPGTPPVRHTQPSGDPTAALFLKTMLPWT
jgi:hypothetical protein